MSKSLNKSVARAVEILEYISEQNRSVSIAEITNHFKIPRSSVFDILHTLAQSDMLKFDAGSKTFELGIKNFVLGSAYIADKDVRMLVKPLLKEVTAKINETTFFAVENNGMIVYIDKEESTLPMRATCKIGEINVMHSTGLGKAILATKTDEQVKALYKNKEMTVKTENTAKNMSQLLEMLSETRERGFAIDDREDHEKSFCISAPILNQFGQCEGAISISSFYSNEKVSQTNELGHLIMDASLRISRENGYLGNSTYIKSQ